MTLLDWLDYALVNFSAATAIAIDACVLVIFKFRDLSSSAVAFKWAGAVGLTHVLFPMLGFIGGWVIIQRYHLAAGVYFLGALLLGVLIYLILREAIDPDPEAESFGVGSLALSTKVILFWIPVMYVSLDALLSGPGKTVLLERYPQQFAWLSFLIVGVLVALFTLVAGGVSRRIHKQWIAGQVTSPANLSHGMVAGIIGELVLFSFFLTWSLSKAAYHFSGSTSLDLPLSLVLVIGVVLGGAISVVFCRRIMSAQLNKVLALDSSKAT